MPNLNGNSWGTPQLGDAGGVVTWSLAAAGSNIDRFSSGSGVSVDGSSFLSFDFVSEISQALAKWSAAGNIEFMQIEDSGGAAGSTRAADIRIFFGAIPGGTLGSAFFPSSSGSAIAGDVLLDIDPILNGDLNLFRALLVHEFGHSLGLGHVSSQSVMTPLVSATTLQADDIDGITQIYGAQDNAATSYTMPFFQTDMNILEASFQLAVTGNDAGNSIDGTSASETIFGMGGDDVLLGRQGNDRLVGALGNDTLRGGDGADTLNGGDGDDFIFGGESSADLRDIVFAGAGNDSVDGGYGNDEISGQDGNDTIAGGFGSDTLNGQNGNDVLTGSALSDLVSGNAGDDFVNGGFGHDRINGGTGADRFFHLGILDHGSDFIQDYNAVEGDLLLSGITGATRSQFQVNLNDAVAPDGEKAGDDAVQEAFVIYRPTGQILWALIDGAGQGEVNLRIGADTFDLLA
jgi:Ca2+-binding RTX toxin-like protein